MLINIPTHILDASTLQPEHHLLLDILYHLITHIRYNPDYHITATFRNPHYVIFYREGSRYWRHQPQHYRDTNATRLGAIWCYTDNGTIHLQTKLNNSDENTLHELENPNIYNNITKIFQQTYDRNIETAKQKRNILSTIHKETRRNKYQ